MGFSRSALRTFQQVLARERAQGEIECARVRKGEGQKEGERGRGVGLGVRGVRGREIKGVKESEKEEEQGDREGRVRAPETVCVLKQ